MSKKNHKQNLKHRRSYEHAFTVIKNIVDEWDPVGLWAMGSPTDEYESEIREITRLSFRINSVEELANAIQYLFVARFEEQLPMETCTKIASKIMGGTSTY
ncbi:hypothetical protein BN1080_01743 [Planococcus massiliensis]|uniref:DUF1871 domain-containing protein n=1 Tax=Planococcus massiliensis TaxID=1499687 RepID=A0A098EKG0_9BACL|nr:DUF1871 family protein [Planococcus massiliensis]CEG22808.1 hypothetical protein BN1080_01743 [Planococcus massiliensis]